MSTDHVVLVTGGNRGIGRSIAERFVAEGYPVAVTARSGEGPAGTLTVRATKAASDTVLARIIRIRELILFAAHVMSMRESSASSRPMKPRHMAWTAVAFSPSTRTRCRGGCTS